MKTKGNIIDIYPLSPLQEGMLFHSLYEKNSSAYFVQLSFFIYGIFDVEIAKKSYEDLIMRHEILRTVFIHEELQTPVQCVLSQRELLFDFQDISQLNGKEKEELMIRMLTEDRSNYFNLNRDVLIRFKILKLNEERYYLLWSFHHIIIDGWCKSVLISDFTELYKSHHEKRKSNLPTIPRYREYIEWVQNQDKKISQDFWLKMLEGYDSMAEIPLRSGHKKKSEKLYFEYQIDEDLTCKIKKLAQNNNTTLNVIVQAIWGILLAKYNGVEDVVFGTVVSGRPSDLHRIERMVGLFINTIPIRIKFSNSVTFEELIQSTHKVFLESESHHYFPLAEIQSLSSPKRNLFDHILIYESYPDFDQIDLYSESKKIVKNKSSFYGTPHESFAQNHYDFYLVVGPHNSMNFRFFYDPGIFQLPFIQGIADNLYLLINQIVEYPDKNINLFKFGIQEYQKSNKRIYPPKLTLQEMWNKQVYKHPQKIAIRYGNEKLKYCELDEFTNRIAIELINSYNIVPQDRCGILIDQSYFGIISMLAIAKAQAIFVPLDPKLPNERLKYMVSDAGMKLILTESSLLLSISEFFEKSIYVLDLSMDNEENNIENVALPVPYPIDILYIIYTSGSTGIPKGVLVSNRSLVNYVQSTSKHYLISESDQAILLSSIWFDLGFTAIWNTLLNGLSLHIQDHLLLNPEGLIDYLVTNSITFIKTTPSFFNTITHSISAEKLNDSELRLVIFGGERLISKDVKWIYELGQKRIQVVNEYGPTETTVGSLIKQIDWETFSQDGMTQIIGQSIDNTSELIVDSTSNVLPPGASGELYLAGIGLAFGYLNQPTLTSEKFIRCFSDPDVIYYRTGDKCRRLLNGEIEYLGRIDRQFKMRGYRIEPEEIISNLLKLHGINQAEIIAHQGRIIAYLTLQFKLPEEEIISFLNNRIPEYMIPDQFVFLDEFPVNSNGKLDRINLPKPDNTKIRELTEPQNELQSKLVELWCEVLELEEISIHDDFFEIGGHSLKGVKLSSRIHKEMNIRIDLKQLFDFPTIMMLAEEIERIQMILEMSTDNNRKEGGKQVII